MKEKIVISLGKQARDYDCQLIDIVVIAQW